MAHILTERSFAAIFSATLDKRHYFFKKQYFLSEAGCSNFFLFMMKFDFREIYLIDEPQNLIPKNDTQFSAQKLLTN